MSIDLLKKSFDISQSIPKDGEYKLQLIKLSDIDVVFKEIANREFFHWDININKNIDWIKNNFDKLPPIILEEFNSKYYSIDEHHRITAAIELNEKDILAFVLKVDELSYIRK
jgi:hypothetical protein